MDQSTVVVAAAQQVFGNCMMRQIRLGDSPTMMAILAPAREVCIHPHHHSKHRGFTRESAGIIAAIAAQLELVLRSRLRCILSVMSLK